MATLGLISFALGALTTLVNVYTSLVRYPLHRLLGGRRETYRHVSGYPLVGSILLWISIPLLPSASWMLTAAALSLVDTGGIHWFAWSMIRTPGDQAPQP